MSILHLCNTFFEWELADNIGTDLKTALEKNPIFAQLQFLPYLYGNPQDGVLVSQIPKETPLPTFSLQDNPPFQKLETWGYSLLAKKWAEEKGIAYPMPPWDVVKMVNSKTYSFSKSPLPGSRLVYQGDPIEKGTVLKSCFGTAGRGLIPAEDPKAHDFCMQEWGKNLPVIAEPWVERKKDFSTQWIISSSGEIAYLGWTLCKTTAKGVHQSNTAGLSPPHFVEQQKSFVMPILEEMAAMGYFGEVGFDAMIYGENQLQPIVEINARKTMGWATLMIQQKKYQDRPIELAYVSSQQRDPLPLQLGDFKFSRQISIQILPQK